MSLCILQRLKIILVLRLILSIVFLIIFNIHPLLSKPNKNNLKKDYLINNFNSSLKKIEKHILSRDNKKFCRESIKAQTIINNHQTELQLLEPYYDWNEIDNLLDALSKQLCK